MPMNSYIIRNTHTPTPKQKIQLKSPSSTYIFDSNHFTYITNRSNNAVDGSNPCHGCAIINKTISYCCNLVTVVVEH